MADLTGLSTIIEALGYIARQPQFPVDLFVQDKSTVATDISSLEVSLDSSALYSLKPETFAPPFLHRVFGFTFSYLLNISG